MKTLLACALLCLALPAAAAADETQVVRFYGYAYDLKSGKYLYTEVHEQNVDGDRWRSGTIRYYLPDGHLMGSKTLDFGNDPFIPVFRLELYDLGYVEAITDNREQVDMMKRAGTGQPEKTARIAKKPAMAADSGFHMFIRAHFAEILRGEVIPFSFAVAGELDEFKFRIKRLPDTRFEGQPAVHLRVEPDSLLRFLVDPLELTYDADSGKLLEYRGVSNIHDSRTGKAYITRIDYYSEPPADAPTPLPPLVPATALP